MKCLVLFSGGKDSVRTAELAMQDGNVAGLLNIQSRNPDSYMFHTPACDMTELQARAMGLPLFVRETAGEEEREVDDLLVILRQLRDELSFDTVAAGALRSTYQKKRVERTCSELGLELFAPLWHVDPEVHMRGLLDRGYRTMLTGVAADGLEKGWLGREIDTDLLDRLMKVKGINIDGEGGEYESLVIWAPFFNGKIVIEGWTEVWRGLNGRIEITGAHLEIS